MVLSGYKHLTIFKVIGSLRIGIVVGESGVFALFLFTKLISL